MINKHHKNLKYRYIKENVFKITTFMAIVFAIAMLIALLVSIFLKGYSAFYTHYYTINIINDNTQTNLDRDFYQNTINNSIIEDLRKIDANLAIDEDMINNIISSESVNSLVQNKRPLGNNTTYDILVSSNVDMILKDYLPKDTLSEDENKILETLVKNNKISKKFNKIFFTNNDSRYPERAGIKGAFLGTLYTIMLTLTFTVVIGVGAGVYLQEFTKKNLFTNFIELNINNLAAIPSIVFGLLGLIVFEQFFNIPRATPILASCVLTLMALPTIIISTKIALSTIPPSIKEAAYGMGATKLQVIFKHMIPMSLPGIFTGIIISISRIIGESAPLLMIGMVAFMNSAPSGIKDKTTVFPIQILLWSDSPEIGYVEKASGAIIILLIILIFINWISVYLRNKFEIKL
jgi:phosphate transport system permease protein